MKLKLDENLSRHLKPELIELGHDVLTAADEDLLSRPDTEIARAASHEHRMLLTLDIEFADLRKYPPGSHPGVILFRPLSLSPLSVNAFIADFIRRTDLGKLAA
jgi:predicted nuclease of predicted toxin-antitoxin system